VAKFVIFVGVLEDFWLFIRRVGRIEAPELFNHSI